MGRPKGSVVFRPEDYVDSLCEWLSRGETLRSWCRVDGNPSREMVDQWRREVEWFHDRVSRARDLGFEELAEDCLAIADDDARDWLDASTVPRAKLRVETRQKLLACWDPRRYGNKVAIGGDADAPPIRTLSTVERAHRLQVILAAVAARAPRQLTNEEQDLLS